MQDLRLRVAAGLIISTRVATFFSAATIYAVVIALMGIRANIAALISRTEFWGVLMIRNLIKTHKSHATSTYSDSILDFLP